MGDTDFPPVGENQTFDEALEKAAGNSAGKSFDDIPSYDPLTPSGRGPGIGDDLTVVKASAVLNQDVAVMGYVIRPSQFDDGGGEYASVEIMDASGKRLLFHTSSKSLMDTLERRFERGEVPFRTRLEKKTSQKSGREFYVFA